MGICKSGILAEMIAAMKWIQRVKCGLAEKRGNKGAGVHMAMGAAIRISGVGGAHPAKDIQRAGGNGSGFLFAQE